MPPSIPPKLPIRDLRPETAAQCSLPKLLNAMGHELTSAKEADAHSPGFRMIIEGKEQTLPPTIQNELYRISCEAIRNPI